MAKKEVSIYGAGMSGLIAAINLAREGHDVVVFDAEKTYGGSSIYNPSTHVTPLNVETTAEYIGIDIVPAFHQVRECPAYFHDTKVQFPVYEIYGVERGNRPGSLDTLLYEECKKLGVELQFSSPLKKENVAKLKPGTIIACGLTPKVYEMIGVPYLPWRGWISRGEADFTDYAWLWFDESINKYGYISAVNNYYFDLLFSYGDEIRTDALSRYKSFMSRMENIEHENWDYVGGAVPVAKSDNAKLFRKKLIMCGTMSGAMCPFFWFGISGALVTGKIAAIAVTNPERAQEEFERFLYRSRRIYYFNEVWRRLIRPHVTFLEYLFKLIGPQRMGKLLKLTETDRLPDLPLPIPFSIPGFGHLNTYKKIK